MKLDESIKQNTLRHQKPAVYDKVIQYGMRIVRIEPSYLCNMRCYHCCIRDLQTPQDRPAMKIGDIEYIAKEAHALGFAQFVISGGEPLMYPDFDQIVKAINPKKFWITTDSNGWYLDEAMANHLKKIGVDKVQLSIDSIEYGEHDRFRQKSGAYDRALKAIDYCKQAGLNLLIQTVVAKKRVHQIELIKFIKMFNAMNVPVCILYAKPVGGWKGHPEVMLNQEDIDFIEGLTKEYKLFSHLTPGYTWQGGCIAMKRMINITKYGDVNPCPVMQEYSIGNIFNESLADIVKRGDERFAGHIPTCIMATDKDFIEGNYYGIDA